MEHFDPLENRTDSPSPEAYRHVDRDAFYLDCIARFHATPGNETADDLNIAAEEWAAAETEKRFGPVSTVTERVKEKEIITRDTITITLAGPDGAATELSLDEALEAFHLG